MTTREILFVLIPLIGLSLLTLTIMIAASCAKSGKADSATRALDYVCIYPAFAAIVFGFYLVVTAPEEAFGAVVFSVALMVQAAAVRLRLWLRAPITSPAS